MEEQPDDAVSSEGILPKLIEASSSLDQLEAAKQGRGMAKSGRWWKTIRKERFASFVFLFLNMNMQMYIFSDLNVCKCICGAYGKSRSYHPTTFRFLIFSLFQADMALTADTFIFHCCFFFSRFLFFLLFLRIFLVAVIRFLIARSECFAFYAFRFS